MLSALAVHVPRQVKYVYLQSVGNGKTIKSTDGSDLPVQPEFRFYSTNLWGGEQTTLVKNNIAFSTDGGGTFTYAGEVINGVIVPPVFGEAGRAPTFNDARFTLRLPGKETTSGQFYNGIANYEVSSHKYALFCTPQTRSTADRMSVPLAGQDGA